MQDEWSKHDGRGRPVPPEAIVEVRATDGSRLAARADAIVWRHDSIEAEGRVDSWRALRAGEIDAATVARIRAGELIDRTGRASA